MIESLEKRLQPSHFSQSYSNLIEQTFSLLVSGFITGSGRNYLENK